MATITQVTMGREGHYRVTRIRPDTSATILGRCECGAIWHHTADSRYDTFSDWMLLHPAPTVVRADVQCAGTAGLIHENGTDSNGVGSCPTCHRYRPTSPQEGYPGWRQFDPHPIWMAVTP
jgi:hypothetical protein